MNELLDDTEDPVTVPAPTEIAPGLWAHLPAVVTMADVGGYDVTLTLDLTDDGLRPVGVNLTAREGSAPINTATLRAIPLAALTRAAIENAVNIADSDDRQIVADRHDKRIDDERLQQVARVYRLARLIGTPVSKYVQAKFGLPRSTATYWIKAARERGYLETCSH